MTAETINEFAGFIAFLAAIPATLNALIYGFGSPWYTSWLGRVIFAKWLSVALVFYVILARRWFGDYFGYEWVAIVAYSLILVSFSATTVELLIERRGPQPQRKATVMTDRNDATTIWYKTQRVLRTIVQTAIPSFITFALVLPQIIAALGLPMESDLYLWLIGLAAGVTAVAAALARVMAIPAVNDFLISVGIGSVPKKALQEARVLTDDGRSGEVVTVVVPDPKVAPPFPTVTPEYRRDSE